MRRLKVRRKIFTACALTITMCLAGPGALSAQEHQQQGAAPQQEHQAVQFDMQTLDKFAAATVKIGEIQKGYSDRLQKVQDQGEAMRLQEEANMAMINAVQEQGIDVPTYNAVANQMRVDPELRKKVDVLLEQR